MTTQKRGRWSEREEEQLYQEYHKYMSLYDMTKTHQRTRPAIGMKLVRILIKRGEKIPPELNSFLAAVDYYDDRRLYETDTAPKISSKAVSNAPPVNKNKSWRKAEEEEVYLDYKNGVSIEDIAKKHNRTFLGIKTRLYRILLDKEGEVHLNEKYPRYNAKQDNEEEVKSNEEEVKSNPDSEEEVKSNPESNSDNEEETESEEDVDIQDEEGDTTYSPRYTLYLKLIRNRTTYKEICSNLQVRYDEVDKIIYDYIMTHDASHSTIEKLYMCMNYK